MSCREVAEPENQAPTTGNQPTFILGFLTGAFWFRDLSFSDDIRERPKRDDDNWEPHLVDHQMLHLKPLFHLTIQKRQHQRNLDVTRRRTNVQQRTCNIDLSNSFYYLFFSFVLLELKPFVLKGKVLGEKFWKSEKVRKVGNYEAILPFSCCPLVFPWVTSDVVLSYCCCPSAGAESFEGLLAHGVHRVRARDGNHFGPRLVDAREVECLSSSERSSTKLWTKRLAGADAGFSGVHAHLRAKIREGQTCNN